MFVQHSSAHIPQVCETLPNDVNLTAKTHEKKQTYTESGTTAVRLPLQNWHML